MSDAATGSSQDFGEIVSSCLGVLHHQPAGLICDIDGTISEIALVPKDARVDPGARVALRRLQRRLALVAILTGRSALDGYAMIDLDGMVCIGNHGMERFQGAERWDHPAALASTEALSAAMSEVAGELEILGLGDGLIFEDKRLSGSIHYRLSHNPAAARAALLEATVRATRNRGLILTEGRFIVELRPDLAINKGTAISDLVSEFGLRSVVFFGDDLTDVDGFKAIRLLRDAGEVRGLRVGVRARETQPEVLAEVDHTVDGVAATVELLTALADALDAECSTVREL
ncbi:MAG: trehalose-phosphatase [Chloroflexota bacterium]|nr:trehalose-phosphatase [Chloroflexota bacterium]